MSHNDHDNLLPVNSAGSRPSMTPNPLFGDAEPASLRPRSMSIASRLSHHSQASSRAEFSHVVSRTGTSHSNTLSRALSGLVDAVRDDNLITTKQEAGEEPVMPESGLNLIERVMTHQAQLQASEIGSEKGSVGELVEGMPQDITNGAPDGGYSWVIALCALFLSSATWGANASYGVFLNYYISADYFPGATSFDYAIIGGLVIGMATFTAPFVFILVSYMGLKPTMLLGVAIQTGGYLGAAFVRTKAGLYCTQGMMIGLSFGLIFNSSLSILPNWFYYKRSIASGMTVSGSGLGGIMYSLASNSLMQRTGSHRYPLIMVGLTTCFTSLVCVALIREFPKTSPKYKAKVARLSFWPTVKLVMNPQILRNFEVGLVGLWFLCLNLSYITLMFSIAAYATSQGLSPKQGSNITAIMNLGQFIGRPSLGYLSDRFGRINFSFIVTLVVAILVLAYWTNATTYGAIIGFALLSGLTVGIGAVNNQPFTVDASGVEMFPAAFSYVNWTVTPLLTFAEVIALRLRLDDTENPFFHCQILTGCMLLFSCFVLLLMRERKILRVVTQRQAALVNLMHPQPSENPAADGEGAEWTSEQLEANLVRLAKYDFLVSKGVKGYFSRMFYPIKT